MAAAVAVMAVPASRARRGCWSPAPLDPGGGDALVAELAAELVAARLDLDVLLVAVVAMPASPVLAVGGGDNLGSNRTSSARRPGGRPRARGRRARAGSDLAARRPGAASPLQASPSSCKMVGHERPMPLPTTAKLWKPKSEDEFEDMCVDFLRIRWNDPHAGRNGRRGQRQHGVDIVGHPPRLNGRTAGAQCKNTDGLKLRDVVAEAKKAKSFEGGLGEFLIITSSDRDATLQTKVREHFKAKPAPFRVEIIFWDDIIADLAQNEPLVAKHWKGFPSEASEELISDRRAKTVPWDEVRTALLRELDEIEDVAKLLLDATSRESLDGVSVDWTTPVWTAFRSEIEKREQRWWSDVASVYANWESLKTTVPGEAVVYGGPEFAARAIAGMASCGPICQRLIPLVGRVRRLVAAESDGTQIKKAATKRAKKPRTKR